MLRLFALLLCIIISFSLCGCEKANKKKENEKYYVTEGITKYYTFDEIVSMFATDVIKGKCVKKETTLKKTELEIQVLERYVGEEVNENIFVEIKNSVSSHNKDNYEEGKEYYFILDRHKSVYYEHDIYIVAGGDIYIPAENVKESTVHNEAIPEHSDLPEAFDEEILLEYIKKLINTRGYRDAFSGVAYTESTDIQNIISEAEYVVEVKALSEEDTPSTVSDIFFCEVTDALKGDIEKNTEIEVLFPEDVAQKGKKYLLALNLSETGRYHFSSKNSLLDTDQVDEIISYIKQ